MMWALVVIVVGLPVAFLAALEVAEWIQRRSSRDPQQ